MKCTNCQNEAHQFFHIKLPVYPFSISKKIKESMPKELNKMITLKYNSCNSCGYIFSDISKEDFKLLELIYKNYYNYMNKTNVTNYAMESLLEIVTVYLKHSASVVEIGCYDGSFLLELQKIDSTLKLLGIEPSQIGANNAKKRGFEIINDFFPTKNFTKKVDMFISSHVIEHVPNIYTFLKTQFDQLHTKGIVAFETPNLDWAVINSSNKPFHYQHLILLSKKYIKSILLNLKIEYINIIEIDWRIVVICSKSPALGLFPINEFNFKENEMQNYLEKFQINVSAQQNLFNKLLQDSSKEFWVWGASSFCGNILANLGDDELTKIKGIIDSDEEKEGNQFIFSSLCVTIPQRINELNIRNIIIMSTYENEIMDFIKTLNIHYNITIYTIYTNLDSYDFSAKTNTFTKTT